MMIKRSEGLQGTLGLGTAVNHSYDVLHAFYCDLSERFGNCAHWWVSRTRQGCGGLPGLSFLLLGHLSSALSLPWAQLWQVRCAKSSRNAAGLRDTAGVNEVNIEPNSEASEPHRFSSHIKSNLTFVCRKLMSSVFWSFIIKNMID